MSGVQFLTGGATADGRGQYSSRDDARRAIARALDIFGVVAVLAGIVAGVVAASL